MSRSGMAITALSCVLFGAGVAAAAAANDYPLFAGQALRFGVAAVVLALVVLVRRRPMPALRAEDLRRLAGIAVLGLIMHNVALVLATRETDASAVGVIVGCTPIVLAVAAPLMQRRRPSPRIVGAAVVVAIGAAIAQGGPGDASALGIALSVIALASSALFSLLALEVLPRLGPLVVTLAVAALASVMFAGLALATDGPVLAAPTAAQAAGLVFLGVAVLAYVAWYAGMQRLGADRAGLFFGLVPASALFAAAATGEGTLTPGRVAGCALIVAALSAITSRASDRAGDARGAEHHQRQPSTRVHRPTRQPEVVNAGDRPAGPP